MATASKDTATTAELSDQIATLRADLGNLTHTIAGIGKAKGDDAVAATKAKVAEVQSKAADQAEIARQQAVALQGQANDFIRTQPAAALGIAASIGFLIGFLGHRK